MIRILAADGIDKLAHDSLIEMGYEVVEQFYEADELGKKLHDFDVLVVRSATKVRKPIIDKALEGKRLKLIIRGGVGVDNIDVDYAKENGIKVFNTPNASSISVAELTIAHMFTIARFINNANITMREGKWEKKQYKGIELYKKTLGLIGFGRIAKEVAVRAKALGMNVIYTDIAGKEEEFDEFKFATLDNVLRNADFLSLHIPHKKGNKPLIGKDEIAIMKDGAFIINAARGGVVDETELLNALNCGKIKGAALDVFEEEPTKNYELINHPNVSVTPHIGASTKEAQKRIGAEIVDIIQEQFK